MTTFPLADTARGVFSEFLATVVAEGVFSDEERTRQSGLLEDEAKREIALAKRIDARVPFLAAISGKGGWSPDPDKAKVYGRFANVSLLDHLCSVVRGALVFAELDLRAFGVTGTDLEQRMAVIAAIAFLHDADKMLSAARSEQLAPEQIAGLSGRYHIDRFLQNFGKQIDPAIFLACIEEVEVTRKGWLRPGMPVPPRELLRDCKYVQLADRLDGKFLDTSPETGGPHAIIKDLNGFEGLRTGALKKGMRVIRIDDPHSAFLLDELQEALSYACLERHGHRPLIEVHHDGRLLCILPEEGLNEVVEVALRSATRELGAGIRVDINTRGAIRLLDAPATLAELAAAVGAALQKTRDDLLRVSIDFAKERRQELDEFFQQTPFLPKWPERLASFAGRLVPMFQGNGADDFLNAFLSDAQLTACTLSCTDVPNSKKLGIPVDVDREAELRQDLTEHLGVQLPEWLGAADPISRRAVLAAFVAAKAQQEPTWREKLLGADGRVALWLEGRGERKGLNAGIAASGSRLAEAVKKHFTALIHGRLVIADDENVEGRCHFTNQPVSRDTPISMSTGLYAVNVTAFSGREGRPEAFNAVVRQTLVSPIAEAEHRLRQVRFGKKSDKRNVPVRVSSPTTAGLFPALLFDRSSTGDFALSAELAFSDILRRKTDGGKLTFSDTDGLMRRMRIARYEEMPTRLMTSGREPGQIAFVKMVFEVAQRTGRPVHLFRGLARPNPAFVAFDALPPAIEFMLGGREFRLEQLGEKIRLLKGIEAIADATGFGVELALAVGDPATRFAASCDALIRCARREEEREAKAIRDFVINLIEQSEILMTNTDRALVDFGEAMARVQRAPIRSDGGSVSETGLRVALAATEAMLRMGQTSPDALKAAIAGELQDALSRRSLYAGRGAREETLNDAIASAVDIFVNKVWSGAFKGRSPAMKARRVAIATYRWSFERAARANRAPQEANSSL